MKGITSHLITMKPLVPFQGPGVSYCLVKETTVAGLAGTGHLHKLCVLKTTDKMYFDLAK